MATFVTQSKAISHGISSSYTQIRRHLFRNFRLVERIFQIAASLGYPSLRMVSGAGHDASYMSQVCPTAMIFVPSIGGRSHVEVEETKWTDCEAGSNVLLHAIVQSAEEG